MKNLNHQKYLSILLWLITAHSIFVGIGLILFPPSIIYYLGLQGYEENFFQYQGGVFHFAMCIAYGMAAYDTKRSHKIIQFIILVKFIAFIFLIIYFIFIFQSWVILMSAIADGIMGALVLVLFKAYLSNDINKE